MLRHKYMEAAEYSRACQQPLISDIQAEVEELMSQWFNNDLTLNFATLSIVEALANSFEHGGQKTSIEDFYVNLSIFRKDNLIAAVIKDNGVRIPLFVESTLTERSIEMPRLDVDDSQLPESGWGLNLMKHASKSISYERRDAENYLELIFDSASES